MTSLYNNLLKYKWPLLQRLQSFLPSVLYDLHHLWEDAVDFQPFSVQADLKAERGQWEHHRRIKGMVQPTLSIYSSYSSRYQCRGGCSVWVNRMLWIPEEKLVAIQFSYYCIQTSGPHWLQLHWIYSVDFWNTKSALWTQTIHPSINM